MCNTIWPTDLQILNWSYFVVKLSLSVTEMIELKAHSVFMVIITKNSGIPTGVSGAALLLSQWTDKKWCPTVLVVVSTEFNNHKFSLTMTQC